MTKGYNEKPTEKATQAIKDINPTKIAGAVAGSEYVQKKVRNLGVVKKLLKIDGVVTSAIKKATPFLKSAGLDGFITSKSEIGSYGENIVFEVSSYAVRTFQDFKTTASATYADIALLEGKPRKQFIAPKNRTISFTIKLRQDNNWYKPREMRDILIKMCENGEAHYLIIGGEPLSDNPFVLTEVSDAWDVIYNKGELYSLSINLTLEEYDHKSHVGGIL